MVSYGTPVSIITVWFMISEKLNERGINEGCVCMGNIHCCVFFALFIVTMLGQALYVSCC